MIHLAIIEDESGILAIKAHKSEEAAGKALIKLMKSTVDEVERMREEPESWRKTSFDRACEEGDWINARKIYNRAYAFSQEQFYASLLACELEE
jgi:hypothetical protein